jgi:hypothetical protein
MMEHRMGAHSDTPARLDAGPMLVIRCHVPIGRGGSAIGTVTTG